MSQQQGPLRECHARWLDFAIRMVGVHEALSAEERREITEELVDFITEVVWDYPSIRQWDESHGGGAYWCLGDAVHDRSGARWGPCGSEPQNTEDYSDDEILESMWWLAEKDDVAAALEKARATWRNYERLAGPFRACLRAGLDMACEPSGGVVGYTVGDLRQMFPEGVPAWVVDGFGIPRGDFDAAGAGVGVWL